MYRRGKIITDKHIAECNNKYTTVAKCRNYVGMNRCQQLADDNCTIPLLENKEAKCNIIQENHKPILVLYHANIITDGEHTWNGYTIKGPKLIQFNISTNIDEKTYLNHQEETKEAIHSHTNKQLEIPKILTSESDYKFRNIQKMYKYTIPIEEHPVKFTLYSILSLTTLVLLVYSSAKICQCYKIKQEEKRRKLTNEI